MRLQERIRSLEETLHSLRRQQILRDQYGGAAQNVISGISGTGDIGGVGGISGIGDMRGISGIGGTGGIGGISGIGGSSVHRGEGHHAL